jgi:hypothetical protein
MTQAAISSHDAGLPAATIRKRRKNKSFARWMLVIAGLTAIPGWVLYASTFHNALRARDDSPFVAIIAYVLLIISSITLVLGLWYLLLAQVRRLAHITGDLGDVGDSSPPLRCPNCGWPHDAPDRFCRHCGKPIGAAIVAPAPGR